MGVGFRYNMLVLVSALVLVLVLILVLVLVYGIGVGVGGSIWQHLGSSVASGMIWQQLAAPVNQENFASLYNCQQKCVSGPRSDDNR